MNVKEEYGILITNYKDNNFGQTLKIVSERDKDSYNCVFSGEDVIVDVPKECVLLSKHVYSYPEYHGKLKENKMFIKQK